MRYRVSVNGVMTFILLAAIGLGAFRSGSVFGFKLLYTLTLLTLSFAALAARYFGGDRWLGFALFGWGYFLLGLGPFEPSHTYLVGPTPNPNLPTHDLVEYLIEHASKVPEIRKLPPGSTYEDSMNAFARTRSTRGSAHLMLTWLSAWTGSHVTAAFAAASKKRMDRDQRNRS
jgi:hypothetical protein